MFAFNLWSRFGAFRDPITITQNVTLSIPPKTTVGGMLAAILGMDYNNYFETPEYFNFGYSLVLKNPVRKKSFSQNYIEDYTAKSHLKHEAIFKSIQKSKKLNDCEDDEKTKEDFQKELEKLDDKFINKMPKPKPIRRELLIDPFYLIFIKDFEFEDQIIELLKSHKTGFSLYMGNSEFSANYKFVECLDVKKESLLQLDSFTQFQNNVKFESNRKYSSIYAATQTVGGRKYRDFKRLMFCDKKISLNAPVNGVTVKTEEGSYNCEFI